MATITQDGTVTSVSGSVGTKVLEKDYPYEEGLIAGSTKQTGKPNL